MHNTLDILQERPFQGPQKYIYVVKGLRSCYKLHRLTLSVPNQSQVEAADNKQLQLYQSRIHAAVLFISYS